VERARQLGSSPIYPDADSDTDRYAQREPLRDVMRGGTECDADAGAKRCVCA